MERSASRRLVISQAFGVLRTNGMLTGMNKQRCLRKYADTSAKKKLQSFEITKAFVGQVFLLLQNTI